MSKRAIKKIKPIVTSIKPKMMYKHSFLFNKVILGRAILL